MPRIQEFQKDLVIKPSRIKGAGLGLYAGKGLPKGTLLGWYRGEPLTRREWKRTEKDTYIWLMLDTNDDEYYIDARPIKKSNKLRYVNGCFTPGQLALVNVEAYQSDDRMWYRTTKKLHRGEELIVNYGGDYWHEDNLPGCVTNEDAMKLIKGEVGDQDVHQKAE